MKKTKKLVLAISLLALLFVSYEAGIFVGEEKMSKTPPSQIIGANPTDKNVDFSIFWESWKQLENHFLDKGKIDYKKMVYGAVKGMVATLGDPYTVFFDPKENSEFNQELSGKYEGVGMEVAIKDNIITVVTPLENTPAQKVGLRPKDKILKIGDISTDGMSLEKAVSLIRGPRGSEVKLLIGRNGWEKPKEFTLKRELIKIPTLKWEIKKADNAAPVAYIKIYQFNQILDSEFQKAASEILNSPAKKIVLDLRNNPGGYLSVAQDISGWFLKRGDVVVWEDFGSAKKRKVYKASGPSAFSQYPIVVLINEGSASAAEILAGALRDNRGIKLIGEKSFGKGSVQEQVPLSDKSSIKITIARWLTPKGHSINEKGLTPDVNLKMEEKKDIFSNPAEDKQLEKALQVVRGL